MRLDYIFYIIAGLNVVGSFIGTNPISSALGWLCAMGYCWGFNSDRFASKQKGVTDGS